MKHGCQFPLSLAMPGRSVVLRRVRGGHGLTSRLAALGLLPGVVVDVCNNDRHGPLVVSLKGSRLMLGRGMADKLAVEESGEAGKSSCHSRAG
ncbi:MAG: ferrous iron transport protein A [Kiritimatiellia bacterium]